MIYNWIIEKAFSSITEADHQDLKDNAEMLMNTLLRGKELLMRETVVTPESNKSTGKKRGAMSLAEVRAMSPKVVSVYNEVLTEQTLELLKKYQAALEAVDTELYVKSIITIIKVADYNPKPVGKIGYFLCQLEKISRVAEKNPVTVAEAYVRILHSHAYISGDNSVDFNDELVRKCVDGLKKLAEKYPAITSNFILRGIGDRATHSSDEVAKLFCRASFDIAEYLKSKKPEVAAEFAALAIRIDYFDERRAQAFEILNELSAVIPNAIAKELIELKTPDNDAGKELISKSHDLLRALIEEGKISEEERDEVVEAAAEKGILKYSAKILQDTKPEIKIS